MKSFYYNLDDAWFVDSAGEKIPRCVPELFYQELAEWRIFLRDRENRVRDLSAVAAWSAAVDCDHRAETTPMCRTLAENIAADVGTGAVTVRIDATTAEFLAAVNGASRRRAYFELCGFDADGGRELCLEFGIDARMILDPDPAVAPETPETLATKSYVAAMMSSGAAAAGALMSGAEFKTTVGGYTVELTSGGGLAVSGSGAGVVLSGGQIAAGVDAGGSVTINAQGVSIEDGIGGSAAIAAGYLIANGVLIGGRVEVATQLITSTVSEMQPVISVLSGGMSYLYTLPLYSVEVSSVVKTTDASYLHFKLDSVTAPTPVVISGVSYLNSATFEGGKEYLVGFFDGMAVVNEVTQ